MTAESDRARRAARKRADDARRAQHREQRRTGEAVAREGDGMTDPSAEVNPSDYIIRRMEESGQTREEIVAEMQDMILDGRALLTSRYTLILPAPPQKPVTPPPAA